MAHDYRNRFGAPDVLVNNAGYAVYETFERMSAAEIRRLFDVNLSGAALVTRAFLPDMIRAGDGDIVMVSSIAGRIPMTPCSVYSASKHGMVALAELLRVEASRFNVRVQVVCPGRVETDFFSHESFRRRSPRREMARTVAIDVVSRAIIDAIERNRFMTTFRGTTAFSRGRRQRFRSCSGLCGIACWRPGSSRSTMTWPGRKRRDDSGGVSRGAAQVRDLRQRGG